MEELNLILIRHGETDFNLKPRRFQGWLDIELNETGKTQGERICNRLIDDNYKFDKVYSSDLSRAKQTIKPYLINKNFDNNNIIYTKELRERDSGDLSGQFIEEVRSNLNPGESINDLLCKFGENELVFQNRIQKFIHKIIKDHLINLTEQTTVRSILIATHGGVLEIIDQLFPSQGFYASAPKNCSIYEIKLSYSKDENEINNIFNIPGLSYNWIIYNDNAHLFK